MTKLSESAAKSKSSIGNEIGCWCGKTKRKHLTLKRQFLFADCAGEAVFKEIQMRYTEKKSALQVTMIDVLICPECKTNSLEILDKSRLTCTCCDRKYPVKDGIPILFKESAMQELDYYIRLNLDDVVGFRGEDFYEDKGHDVHLVTAINAKSSDLVLDLGCGHGHVSKWIAENSGATVLSYDMLYEVLAKRKDLLSICGSADNIVFADNTFDKVVFTDVLEHLPPAIENDVISEIYRVLKPGGSVYLDYPGSKLPLVTGLAVLNILIFFLRLSGKKSIRYYTKGGEAHVNLKYPYSINKLFARHGFLGRACPCTTKFFSVPKRYKPIVEFANRFPLNYAFSVQIVGTFKKPT